MKPALVRILIVSFIVIAIMVTGITVNAAEFGSWVDASKLTWGRRGIS